jgi:hypothetical protein
MNRSEYLLVQAASECNEVAHRITKALHFGLDECQPGQEESNAQRIISEFIDLVAVMDMLDEAGLLSVPSREEAEPAVAAKKAKVEHFIAFAQNECGTVK